MKILVSKADALGDQVLATAFVQALLRHSPHARIVWHVREGMEAIASFVEHTAVFRVDRHADPVAEARRLWTGNPAPITIVPYPIQPFADWTPELEGLYGWWGRFLAATSWDLAVAPVINRTALSDFTVTASRAAQRVAFAANGGCQPMIEAASAHLPDRKAAFTTEVPSSLHESESLQHARLLDAVAPGTPLNPPVLWVRPEIGADVKAVPSDPSTRLILIAPGVGQNAQRAWPMSHYLRLAGELRTRGHEVRWLEGPHDAAYFQQFPAAESASRITLPAGELGFLVRLLREAQLLICNDTAYVHFAAALDTPAVALFGAGQKGRFVPRYGRVRTVQGDPVCRGCQWQCVFTRHICVQDVPYAAVWTAIEAQLSTPAAAHDRLQLPLPFSSTVDSRDELERVRDWFQEELYRIRWDGWARLQVIKDVAERLRLRDERLDRLTAQATATTAPQSALPKLSVIIPMGRPERADGTLRSLASQSLKPGAWEVVVVGVGASQLLSRYPELPLVPVDLAHNLLPPRTRVEGVARASGEWFVFVDDDVQLAPDFFEMLARILAVPLSADSAGQLSVGAIGVRIPGGRGTYFEHLTDISNFWSQQSPIRAVPHTIWFLYSAAIVVRAEAYHKSGGFNPDLPNGEDVDLTQRIKAAGYLLGYEPSLVAYHFHGRDSLLRMWRYFWRNGNAAQYFFTHFGGACCYSLRTAFVRAWGDLRMNRDFQRTQKVRLGLRAPWILLNYVIFENSLEWHYQEHLWKSRRYRELPARTPSDRNAVAAFTAFAAGRPLAGVGRYALALVQNLTDPVRR